QYRRHRGKRSGCRVRRVDDGPRPCRHFRAYGPPFLDRPRTPVLSKDPSERRGHSYAEEVALSRVSAEAADRIRERLAIDPPSVRIRTHAAPRQMPQRIEVDLRVALDPLLEEPRPRLR